MRSIVGLLLFALAWGLSATFLYDHWRDKEGQQLEEQATVLAVTYRASIEMYRLATEILFEELILHDEVVETFAQGVRSTGATRDRARGKLYRLLSPTYAQLRERGIRQMQFHTATGHSFLRFHAPDKCEDPLFEARPTVRLANTERRAVSGFEAGRIATGFRYVFPVFLGEDHLGSMETSVTFPSIRAAMSDIDSRSEYALVLRREHVDEVLFDGQRPLYETSSLHDDFLVEDPGLDFLGSPPPTASVREFDRQLSTLPRVQKGMAAGESFTVSLSTASGDWAVSFLPIRDILDRQAAYVVAYTKAPFAAALRNEFYLNMGLLTLVFFAFIWFTRGLLRSGARLQLEKQQLQTITDTIADGLYVMDVQGVISRVNPAFSELLGYRAEEIVGQVGHQRFHVHGDGIPRQHPAECPVFSAIGRGQGYVGEELFRRKDGGLLTVEISCQLMRAEGVTIGAVAAFRDISKRKANDERIRYLAQYDTLTNLPNRTLLLDRLQQAIAVAQREEEYFAILFLDIDNFKNINDSLGHMIGDQLLQQVAARLTDCVRGSDTVSRQGGDEFIIILRQIRETADPVQIARKILTSMALVPFTIEGQELRVTTSIGIALYPEDGADSATLIKNADAAMYHAKKLGRNNYQFFTADLNARAHQRLLLENSLRRALESQELFLHYQPLVDLESGRILGVEALLRWRHPELGLVPPEQFIPVAEECGLISSIGEWVIREACRQNKAWQDAGLPPVHVAVNLSPLQFRQQNLEVIILQALEESGLAAAYLEIEITENLLMSIADQTVPLLRRFKEMGMRISIDDFGTGYSSLSYLKHFPIDKLKIDRSFVRDVSSDPDDAAIASAIIAMAHRLRLKVLAEGVETMEQRHFFLQEGCNEAQGYYYSRPLPADEVEGLLRSGRPLPVSPEDPTMSSDLCPPAGSSLTISAPAITP
jgi:diguanylate cyclase (GGDEF)-like protein/PAS domain S-box-containing protein